MKRATVPRGRSNFDIATRKPWHVNIQTVLALYDHERCRMLAGAIHESEAITRPDAFYLLKCDDRQVAFVFPNWFWED
jgi:hypothetical protein